MNFPLSKVNIAQIQATYWYIQKNIPILFDLSKINPKRADTAAKKRARLQNQAAKKKICKQGINCTDEEIRLEKILNKVLLESQAANEEICLEKIIDKVLLESEAANEKIRLQRELAKKKRLPSLKKKNLLIKESAGVCGPSCLPNTLNNKPIITLENFPDIFPIWFFLPKVKVGRVDYADNYTIIVKDFKGAVLAGILETVPTKTAAYILKITRKRVYGALLHKGYLLKIGDPVILKVKTIMSGSPFDVMGTVGVPRIIGPVDREARRT
jgi:hypothetical protein